MSRSLYFVGARCDDDQESYIACSVASSNETADDLPGAGRTLGKLYNYAGRILERQLGSIAEHLGHGPCATAVRIRRHRAIIISASKTVPVKPCSLATIKAKRRKVEKDCKRVGSTKKQALDHITDLSVDDSYIRDLLKVVGAMDTIDTLRKDPAIWINYGFSLQSSSRKALASLADVQVNTLVQKIETALNCYAHLTPVLLDGIKFFLYDLDRSFLIIRHINRLVVHRSGMLLLRDALETVIHFMVTRPYDFEWAKGDRFFDTLFAILEPTATFFVGIKHEDFICTFLESVFRYADRLPRIINSEPFQQWLAALQGGEDIKLGLHAHHLLYFS
ncbi:hypothetical protein EW145_g7508 [Phellinidium pouzarii]|uniref:Uncharacterized protein n=1 Tax=Phellinidium pouzarii TaxID=167371 RepID=A0A4S4KI07_9AGAM|nr:hypothetical protein EW145_g7508 [Phellinidium pouzarii]